MSIDIERLKVDRDYWDKVAPDGAEIYVPGVTFNWRKWNNGIELFYDYLDAEDWEESLETWSRSAWLENEPDTIPRPKAPEAEWVDGLPPVGCECEYRFKAAISSNWFPCKVNYVVGNSGLVAWCKNQQVEQWLDFEDVEFRPIRTKEQRQREELTEILGQLHIEYHGDDGGGTFNVDVGPVADAILSRYNLEPKP